MKIWKFPLTVTDRQIVEMPVDASILSVQGQNEVLCLWAVVDEAADKELRIIRIFGSGHDISDHYDSWNFIGTVQMAGGILVWHVFEE